MQPLLLLALVGIAAIALTVGSLENQLTFTIQDIGSGQATLESPVTSADLILKVERTNPDSPVNFKDLITACTFVVPDGQPTIVAGSIIFCKLLGMNGNVVAEGSIVLQNDLVSPDEIDIPIDNIFIQDGNDINKLSDVLFVVQEAP